MTTRFEHPAVCHWCHSDMGRRRVVVTETVADSSAVTDWAMCSWACAHELVTRMLRSGRDDET
jgi:hypothetical protein